MNSLKVKVLFNSQMAYYVSSLYSGHFRDLVSSLARAESVAEFISVKNICNLFNAGI